MNRAAHQDNVEFNARIIRAQGNADSDAFAAQRRPYWDGFAHGCIDAPAHLPAGSMVGWPGDRMGIALCIAR